MAALTIARNAAVIIETFIVWVHQHGVCIAGNRAGGGGDRSANHDRV
jgi:hypothetical protein